MSNLDGDVYFISDGESVKIGWSGAPPIRMKRLQSEHQRPLTIIGKVPGTTDDERAAHKKFSHLRLDGEWFKPEPELMAFIERVCRDGRLPALAARPRVSPVTAWTANLPRQDVPRMAPDRVPKEATAFKRWSDCACVEWPAALQAEAYRAWEDLHYRGSDEKCRVFIASYRDWCPLTESEKQLLSHPRAATCFRHAPVGRG
jgi:hypothetical protein